MHAKACVSSKLLRASTFVGRRSEMLTKVCASDRCRLQSGTPGEPISLSWIEREGTQGELILQVSFCGKKIGGRKESYGERTGTQRVRLLWDFDCEQYTGGKYCEFDFFVLRRVV